MDRLKLLVYGIKYCVFEECYHNMYKYDRAYNEDENLESKENVILL